MLTLEKMAARRITSANYITSVHGMVHPDRIMDDHDFLYMLDGSWEIMEDDHIYEIRPDDLLILSAKRHHYGEKSCNPGNRHMYFHIQPTVSEMAKKNGMDKMEDSTLFPCHTLIHCQNNIQIRTYMQQIIAVYWSDSPEKANRLSLLSNLLLCELAEIQSSMEELLSSDSLVLSICQQLQSNPQIFYTAKDMANQNFICTRTLNNHFLDAYHKTFHVYQMELKLEMVRQFLQNQPDAKLREAAVNFGFYDEFHLSRAFKKQFGQSPSQFRQGITHV